MRANVNKPTSAQRKAMLSEIRRQCVENTRKYEIELDSVTLYVLHRFFGFGKKRLQLFYSIMFKERKAMQDFFEDEDGECIAEYAMRQELRKDGIDVEKMYNEQVDPRKFKVIVKEKD
ncbi:MAG: hypothetical protein J6S71_02755 [Clostridia bacterium]|nr:hypothetical protein [Clostridia bacterium]